jgi:hypothetical protein
MWAFYLGLIELLTYYSWSFNDIVCIVYMIENMVLKLFIKYIYMAFGERWGPQICELHLAFLNPSIYKMVIV